jgi:Domain of unknown function (DUF4412)
MKSTKVITLASCIACLMLASCAERSQMPAHGYEGTITEVIHMPGIGKLMNYSNSLSKHDSTNTDSSVNDRSSGDDGSSMGAAAMGALTNVGLKMYVRENVVAYDISMLGGLITMHSIIDGNARTMTMLMPNHTAMVMDLRALDSSRGKIDDSLRAHNGFLDSLQAMLPQPTGKTQTIHGLQTEEYHATKGAIETDLWLSDDVKLKAFDVVRDAFLGRGTEGQGELDQIFGMMRSIAGKIPVKFETKLNGEVVASGELTDITEEKLDDALFEIPKDYTIVNGDSIRAAKQQKRHFTAP